MADTYLVTGGAGFIGTNLVRRILKNGAAVTVLDNFSTGLPANVAEIRRDIRLVKGDLRNPADVRRAVKGVRYIIHAGALPSVSRSVEDPATTHEVNITGTLNLLLAARDAGVERLVFSSSSSVYGNTRVLPKREDMTPNPLSPYALSKLAGEHYCKIFHQLFGLQTFVLRYFNVFGPRQNPKSQYAAVIPLFIAALRNNQSPVIHGDGRQTRDFTYVDDVVAANLACCRAPEKAAGGVYNVAWGNRLSIHDLAVLLAKLMDKDIKPHHAPRRTGDVRDSQADSRRARRYLGWKPEVKFEEGLRRTIAWFSQSP